MASLKDLRRRIRATKSMQQIFKAMEMVAAAKLRRAQARAKAASPYSEKITDMLANLSESAAELQHPLFKVREVKTTALVVISADRGFAGASCGRAEAARRGAGHGAARGRRAEGP